MLKVDGNPGKNERGDVGKVVPAVRDQRQAVRHGAGNELRGHQREGQYQSELYEPGGGVRVMVCGVSALGLLALF